MKRTHKSCHYYADKRILNWEMPTRKKWAGPKVQLSYVSRKMRVCRILKKEIKRRLMFEFHYTPKTLDYNTLSAGGEHSCYAESALYRVCVWGSISLLAQTVAEGINFLATPVCYNSTARQTPSLKPESENCPLNVGGRAANTGWALCIFQKHTQELVTADGQNFSINKENDAQPFHRFDLSHE